MAPETINGEPCSYATDIWALGVILYKMSTGEDLFGGLTEYGIYEKIKSRTFSLEKVENEELRDLIARILVMDPKQRPGFTQESFEQLKTHNFFSMKLEALQKSKKEVLRSLVWENYLLFFSKRENLVLYDDGTLEIWDEKSQCLLEEVRLGIQNCAYIKGQ